MAHNLEIRDGVASFVFNRRNGAPWHGLGQSWDGPMTVNAALALARADFRVGLAPISWNGRIVDEIDDKLTVRLDTMRALATVGGDYTVMDYIDVAHSIFDPAFGQDAECMETAGVLGNGERFFATAQLNGETEIRDGDALRHYLLTSSSHDGSMGVTVLETTTRVVCQNTLNVAIKGAKHRYSLRHGANVEANLQAVGRMLGSFAKYREEQARSFRELAKRPCSTRRAAEFVQEIFPSKRTIDEETGQEIDSARSLALAQKARNRVLALFDGAADAPELNTHSDWDLFQAVTQYVDRDMPARAQDSAVNKWLASTFNPAAEEIRQNAYQYLVRS